MRSIGIGVIGAGVMGAEHARIIAREVSGAHLAAVADADPARAEAAAHGGRAMTDPEALIADPSVEAVLIASPDATHQRLVLAAIAAGKPVLCEKPLAVTTQDCLEIVVAETRAGRRLVQTGFMRRFDPTYRELKATLEGGTLGGVRILHCQHRNAAAPTWFTGEMAITNSLVHEIDVCRWLLSTEYRTVTVTPFLSSDPKTSDPSLFLFETDDGSLVSIELFMNAAYGYHVHAEAVCERGTVGMAHPAPVRIRREGSQSGGYPENWIPRFRDAYRIQNQAWVDGIHNGVPAVDGASAWDGLVATCLAEQIIEAKATRQRTTLKLPHNPSVEAFS
ncbi:Gfo/Idh/MocA family oxidoreductase [Shinella zoogloeoides]|uniref:Gfo/Idh/MocA family protein n=1 Tax=Shinella zoogloeoides TaxID=352475 RepID=UPI0028AE355C|nr:Gfo/Idh/MocA family oxidoreductase [Shinella zoogloeoides]